LDIPKYRSLNIHASLLPKYRGCSPIQHVIIDGEEKTGITIMQMDAGIDTGDMLYKKEVNIEKDDNYETLHDKLMVLGGEAIVEALVLLEEGKLVPEKQNSEESCYAPMIDKKMGEIDFAKSAAEIDRLIRGMTPWPSAYTTYRGKQMKIWKAEPVQPDKTRMSEEENGSKQDGATIPGAILSVEKNSVLVATGEGGLRILELQLEGKKRMSTKDFLLGVKMQPGEMLGQ